MALVIDDEMGQGYFTDYLKLLFVIFSYAFN